MPLADGTLETVTIPNVELVKVGKWLASTGEATITTDDLDSMVAAQTDEEVDEAPIKLGHVDKRFDGEPAYGWVRNLVRQGDSLFGDLVDVPKTLAAIIPKALRRRSVEISSVKTPAGGRVYKAALTGLALLGARAPAVSGLADIAALYAGQDQGSRRVLFAAPIKLDGIRSAWREQRRGATVAGEEDISESVEVWTEFLIVREYRTGRTHQVPWEADDAGKVTFGDPVEVRSIYVPVQPGESSDANTADALFAGPLTHWSSGPDASRETQSGGLTVTPETVAATDNPGGNPGSVPDSRRQTVPIDSAKVREALGLAEDATPEAISAALRDAGLAPEATPNQPAPEAQETAQDTPEGETTPAAPEASADAPEKPADAPAEEKVPAAAGAFTAPPGTVLLSSGAVAELQRQARDGAEARQMLRRTEIETALSGALDAGQIVPADEAKWRGQLEKNFEETRAFLSGLTPVVNTREVGYDAAPDTAALSGGQADAAVDEFLASIGAASPRKEG